MTIPAYGLDWFTDEEKKQTKYTDFTSHSGPGKIASKSSELQGCQYDQTDFIIFALDPEIMRNCVVYFKARAQMEWTDWKGSEQSFQRTNVFFL